MVLCSPVGVDPIEARRVQDEYDALPASTPFTCYLTARAFMCRRRKIANGRMAMSKR